MLIDLLQIWIHGIGVFMVFVVTLALFPTVLTNIQSVSYHSDKPEKHPWSGKHISLIGAHHQ